MTQKNTSPDQLITTVIAGIEDVKGKEIIILDLRELENTVCDYFIICEGTSNTQVNAIVNSIQKKVSKEHRDKLLNIKKNRIYGTI
jgi:ribosome-associated protein